MAPWLERARVSVAPLRVGTGVRVKALEALAAGVPVVGTTVAFEGIDLEPAEAAIVDDVGPFADAVVALLTDEVLAGSRRAAGRALAEARFSWKSSARQLADALL
jgi:glycosyltransferase involved in cell wall biosynthesis